MSDKFSEVINLLSNVKQSTGNLTHGDFVVNADEENKALYAAIDKYITDVRNILENGEVKRINGVRKFSL